MPGSITVSRTTLRGHYEALLSRYGELEDTYCSLSVAVRRNVLGPFPEERFYCAAILQWRPSIHAFSAEKLFGKTDISKIATQKSGRIEANNELCPIWNDFFNDLRTANRLLTGVAGLPLQTQDIRAMLTTAEGKADWIEEALEKIQGCTPPSKWPETNKDLRQYTYGGWNEFCLEIRGGRKKCNATVVHPSQTVLAAVAKLQAVQAGSQVSHDFDMYGSRSSGIRRWFAVTQDMLPFNQTADDIPHACVGWLFTDYNNYGQYDPAKQFLHSLQTGKPDIPGREIRARLRRCDVSDISREEWQEWVDENRGAMSAASYKRACKLRTALHRLRQDDGKPGSPAANVEAETTCDPMPVDEDVPGTPAVMTPPESEADSTSVDEELDEADDITVKDADSEFDTDAMPIDDVADISGDDDADSVSDTDDMHIDDEESVTEAGTSSKAAKTSANDVGASDTDTDAMPIDDEKSHTEAESTAQTTKTPHQRPTVEDVIMEEEDDTAGSGDPASTADDTLPNAGMSDTLDSKGDGADQTDETPKHSTSHQEEKQSKPVEKEVPVLGKPHPISGVPRWNPRPSIKLKPFCADKKLHATDKKIDNLIRRASELVNSWKPSIFNKPATSAVKRPTTPTKQADPLPELTPRKPRPYQLNPVNTRETASPLKEKFDRLHANRTASGKGYAYRRAGDVYGRISERAARPYHRTPMPEKFSLNPKTNIPDTPMADNEDIPLQELPTSGPFGSRPRPKRVFKASRPAKQPSVPSSEPRPQPSTQAKPQWWAEPTPTRTYAQQKAEATRKASQAPPDPRPKASPRPAPEPVTPPPPRPTAPPPAPPIPTPAPEPSTPSTTPWNTRELPTDPVQLYRTYNEIWTTLTPEAAIVPFPGPNLRHDDLAKAAQTAQTTTFPTIPVDRIQHLGVQIFLLQGFSIPHELEQYAVQPFGHTEMRLRIQLTGGQGDVGALRKHLRLRETPRWHPDQINRRTGVVGLLHEGNGRDERVVMVREAVRELVEICGEIGGR